MSARLFVHPFVVLSYLLAYELWLEGLGLEALGWGSRSLGLDSRPETLALGPCPQGAGLGVLTWRIWLKGPVLEALAWKP